MHHSIRLAVAAGLVAAVAGAALKAQEEKPVPKGSRRIAVTGCSKDYIFTAGGRPAEDTRSSPVPEGAHLRMNGPKELIAQIKAREGTVLELTGLVKEGQYIESGSRIRMRPANPGSGTGNPIGRSTPQVFIDVEGWRAVGGECPSR